MDLDAAILYLSAVLQIRIHMFSGLLDPDPDPLVRKKSRGIYPATDPDPYIIKQKK
jgi:hypothetical protein